jgi:hypothetical protein
VKKYSLYPTRTKKSVCIFKEPEEGTKYSIGVDGAWGTGSDYTSMQVFSNRIPFEQVGWYHSNITDVITCSQIMCDLGWYYNTAMLVIETRAPGNAFQDYAIQVANYTNLYQAEQHLDEDPTISSKYGIATTDAWKSLLVGEMRRLLNATRNGRPHPQVILHDPFTIESFCNFVRLKEDAQKVGAAPGCVDDPVMAAMFAIHGCITYPQAPKVVDPEELDEERAHKKYLLERHFNSKREAVRV